MGQPNYEFLFMYVFMLLYNNNMVCTTFSSKIKSINQPWQCVCVPLMSCRRRLSTPDYRLSRRKVSRRSPHSRTNSSRPTTNRRQRLRRDTRMSSPGQHHLPLPRARSQETNFFSPTTLPITFLKRHRMWWNPSIWCLSTPVKDPTCVKMCNLLSSL